MTDPEVVAANVAGIRARIAAAGGGERTRLVAVTKGFGPDAVRAAQAAGVADIGENYAQDLHAKISALAGLGAPQPRWHFVGRVQRNKVRGLAPHVWLWQSVDRLEVGEAIARHQPGAAVLVQVNVSGEATKAGCEPDEVAPLVGQLRSRGLDVRGLMTVGRAGPGPHVRQGFRRLAELAGMLGLAELSMGMSDDFEVAVEEGATMVRLGRSLFGPRPRP